MRWRAGRTSGEYSVLTLFSSKLLDIDMHVIYFPPHGYVKPHKDPVRDKKHRRLNVGLIGRGDFICAKYKRWWRFTYFRPDVELHSFRNSEKASYILSIGWV